MAYVLLLNKIEVTGDKGKIITILLQVQIETNLVDTGDKVPVIYHLVLNLQDLPLDPVYPRHQVQVWHFVLQTHLNHQAQIVPLNLHYQDNLHLLIHYLKILLYLHHQPHLSHFVMSVNSIMVQRWVMIKFLIPLFLINLMYSV